MEDAWELAFVLPNLRLPPPPGPREVRLIPPLEAGDVAIVPSEDPRVVEIASTSRGAKKLLSGFVDYTGKSISPCAAIYRSSAPDSVNGEALIAFRNAMALSLMLPSWVTLRDDSRLFSDVFDVYPVVVSKSDRLVTRTVSLTAVFTDDAPFMGMASPHIHQSPYLMTVDYYVDAALRKAWIERFQEGADDNFYRTLFRSLEAAYLALATPLRNQGSMYEWGATVGLWVTALEILAHPNARGKKGNVNQRATLKLLGQYRWQSHALTDRKKVTYGHGERATQLELNAIQLAARELYKARNKFQHGAPVTDGDMFPFSANTKLSVIQIAPAIYRTALYAFLQRRYDPALTDDQGKLTWESPGLPHAARMASDTMRVENAVLDMLGLGMEDPGEK